MCTEKRDGLRKAAVIMRVTAFLCIFAALLSVANQFIVNRIPKVPGWQLIYDGKGEDTIDVLFMGNSYAYSAINPYIVNEALNIQSAMIAMSAGNITVSLNQLKEIMEFKKPRLVILELNVLVNKYDDLRYKKRGLVYTNLDSMRLGANKINMAMQLLNPEHLPEALFPVFRSGYLGKALKKNMEAMTEERKLGYDRLTETYEPEKPVDQETLHAWPVVQRQQEDLRSLIRLCKENGVDLWLLNKPRLEPRDLAVIQRIAAEYDVPVINMNELPDKVEVGPLQFYDSGHLNALGANRVTEALVARLAGYLHNTADYANVLTMKDETVEPVDNGTYRFTVNTYAPNATYSFEVYRDTKMIFVQEESSVNSILVKPTTNGTYKVKYHINFYNDGTLISNFSSEFSIKKKT